MTSKRVHRGGHGANGQNGVPGAGGIHGANGCRLANTIATPYRMREDVRQKRALGVCAFMSPLGQRLRTTVTFSCVAISTNPRRRTSPASRGSGRSRPCLPARRSTETRRPRAMPRAPKSASAPASSARATPRRRHCGGDDEADDRGRVVRAERIAAARQCACARRRAQLVVRLRVHPADDVVAGVGEKAFHLAGRDARAPWRSRFAGPSNAFHGNRHRHLVVVAIALRPLGVVGESRPRSWSKKRR